MSDEEVKRGEKLKGNLKKWSSENDNLESSSSSYFTAAEEPPDSVESTSHLVDSSKFAFSTYRINDQESDDEEDDDESEEQKLKRGVKSQRSLHDIQLAESTSPTRLIVKDVVDELPLPSVSNVELSQVRFQFDQEDAKEKLNDISRTSLLDGRLQPASGDDKKITEELSFPKEDKRKVLKVPSAFSTNLEKGHAFVYMILPPDGGYGWFIVLLAFLIQVITDGIILSIGITLPYMAEDLGVGSHQIIFVSALQIAFYFLSGPISSAVINKFGFRKVGMAGAVASIVFFAIASVSPNLSTLILFYSCLGGPSLSMMWVSAQLIVGYYFEKYRPIAAGLSCSGTGVGLFLFIDINSRFVPKYGWRKNTLLQSGFLALAFIFCIGLKEVKPTRIGIIREKKDLEFSSDSSREETEVNTFTYAKPISIKPEERDADFMQIEKITESRMVRQQETSCMDAFRKCCRKRSKTDTDIEMKSFGEHKHYVLKKDIINKQDLYYTGPAHYSEHSKKSKRELIAGKDVELINDGRAIEAINYAFSMHALQKESEEEKTRKRTKRLNCPRLARILPIKIKNAFKILFNVQLFRILEFQIFFASAFTYAFGLNTPFLFSKERANLPTHEEMMIPSIIGASNFASRIISGFIAFSFRQHVVYICGGAVTLGGAIILISVFYGADQFWFQIIYATLFGVAVGFYSTLRAIIYVQYLGLQNLTNAFGLVAMGMGTGIFLGTVIGGFAVVMTGGCAVSFIISGTSVTISGLLILLLPTIVWKIRKKNKKSNFT